MTTAAATYAKFLNEMATSPDVAQLAPSDDSVLRRYHKGINRACEVAASTAEKRDADSFAPPLALPELTSAYADYFAPARMRIRELGEYRSARLSFFDLMRDETTNTTKTFASLGMVSRAIEHVRLTGENVLIVCTTSGNKGTAIRSAVERAYSLGLVRPEQLRVLMIVPVQSAGKLRGSALWRDPELRALNPLVLYEGDEPANVKQLGKAFHDQYTAQFRARRNTRIWYSLDLNNYRTIDAARAFFEFEHFRAEAAHSRKVFHVHAVSSAFGLIGHRFGRTLLENAGICAKAAAPGYFLVQHLATADLVLHLHHRSFERANAPAYAFDERTGKHTQEGCAFFPRVTDSPLELLDPTFYTKRPATSSLVADMVEKCGGGGLVVSKRECIERYGVTRELLAAAGVELPANHDEIGEWSVIMAFTGVLNALERGLLPGDAHAIIHGSGSYLRPTDAIPISELRTVTDRDPVSGLLTVVG